LAGVRKPAQEETFLAPPGPPVTAIRRSGYDAVQSTNRPGAPDHLKRREFISLLGGATLAWPFPAQAQQPNQVRRIGVLMGRAANDPEGQNQAAALRGGLEELGWSSPRNVEIEFRWPAGDSVRARAQAKELVDLPSTSSSPIPRVFGRRATGDQRHPHSVRCHCRSRSP